MKTCLRCGKEYKKLTIHLNRKKICKAIYLDIDKDKILQDYDKYYIQYKELQNEKYECEHCNKTFNQKQNYYRHKKHNCTTINTKSSNTINNIKKSTINNGTNNGTMKVDNSVNIVINNFGEESPIMIKELVEILNECVNKGKLNDILPMYVKKRWIDHENNRNVNITDFNRGIAEVYVNKEWEKKFLNEVIDIIRNKSSKDIFNYLKETKKYLENKYELDFTENNSYNDVNKLSNHIYDTETIPEIKRDVNKKIKLELVNNRNKVRETKKNKMEIYNHLPI